MSAPISDCPESWRFCRSLTWNGGHDALYVLHKDHNMRPLSAALCAMMIAVGSTPAHAEHFSPPGTAVKINASFVIATKHAGPGIRCNATFRGEITEHGKLKIKGVSSCSRVQWYGFPWFWDALQARHPAVALTHMAFSLKSGFDCGTVSDEMGIIKESLVFSENKTSNGCAIVQGTGTATPAIKIVH